MAKQQDNILIIKQVVRNGVLEFKGRGDKIFYDQFVESLEEGQVVEQFLEAYKDDATNVQLAKIHVCIKKIAMEQGETPDETKRLVKESAGLRWQLKEGGWYEKSFADCSKEEITLTMETIVNMGDFLGISF